MTQQAIRKVLQLMETFRLVVKVGEMGHVEDEKERNGRPAESFKGRSKRKKKIFDLWLAGWTQQEIADEVGVSCQEADKQIASFATGGEPAVYGKTDQNAANRKPILTRSPEHVQLVAAVDGSNSLTTSWRASNAVGERNNYHHSSK